MKIIFCRRNGHMCLISSRKDEGLTEHVQYEYHHCSSFLIEEINHVATVLHSPPVTNPSHEHCSTHHQRSLSHHWTLTQLQITLLDYISHHSLHPHSCFTLSRCTCSQSFNHPHTILTLNILPHSAEYC